MELWASWLHDGSTFMKQCSKVHIFDLRKKLVGKKKKTPHVWWFDGDIYYGRIRKEFTQNKLRQIPRKFLV